MTQNISQIISNNLNHPKIIKIYGECPNDTTRILTHHLSKYICRGCKSIVCSYCINKT